MACVLIQSQTAYCIGELFLIVLTFTLGFSIFITDFVLDIEENLHHINNDLISVNKGDLTELQQNHMKKNLFDIISFHSEAKMLSVIRCFVPNNHLFVSKLFE